MGKWGRDELFLACDSTDMIGHGLTPG